jgi:hypothetical protein
LVCLEEKVIFFLFLLSMAFARTFDHSHSALVSWDQEPAMATNFTNAATIGTVDQALKVPLGSQLALLNAQTAGNPYLKYDRIQNQQLPATAYKLTGFDTLTGMANQAPANYFTFSSAYRAV